MLSHELIQQTFRAFQSKKFKGCLAAERMERRLGVTATKLGCAIEPESPGNARFPGVSEATIRAATRGGRL